MGQGAAATGSCSPIASASNQPFQLLPDAQQLREHDAGRRHVGVRIGERYLDQGSLDGQRRPQLVRGIGDEAPLCGIRDVQPGVQLGQGGGQVRELLVPAEFAVLGQPVGGGARLCSRWPFVFGVTTNGFGGHLK
jgi:hypothetical protein